MSRVGTTIMKYDMIREVLDVLVRNVLGYV